MATEIRETTITTDDGASIVRLHIADAPIGDDTAAFRLTLLAKLPRYKAPLLVQIQREAILRAREVLSRLERELLQDVPERMDARPTEI
ncbi:MAG: hypothetical protein ACLQF1_07530 [Methyloceanibacter sp.]